MNINPFIFVSILSIHPDKSHKTVKLAPIVLLGFFYKKDHGIHFIIRKLKSL